MDRKDYIEEKKLKDHPTSLNKKDLKKILKQMEKSICKIKCKDGSFGTGFFCKIPLPDNSNLLPVLITNYHILSEDDVAVDNFINISLDEDKFESKIYINKTRKTFSDPKYDTTIIELTNEDNLDISYLEIEDNILKIDRYDNYKNISAYLIHYPHGNLEVSIGVIKNIAEDTYDLYHLCATETGSSGGPLINLKNFKVLGIHKSAPIINNNNYNLGTFIKGPIKEFYSIQKEKREIKEIDKKQIKSVCKIITKIRGNTAISTGFFCKIPIFKDNRFLHALITNKHSLDEKDLIPGSTIHFTVNEGRFSFNLKIDESRLILTDYNMDFAIIELKPVDGIKPKYCLEIDNGIYSKNFDEVYKNKELLLMTYGPSENIAYSNSKLKGRDDFTLIYERCNGYNSGSPVLNSANNKLLGIHYGRVKDKEILYGIFIKPVIEKFNKYYNKFRK